MFVYPGLGSLMKLSDAQSRSISAENVYGKKGGGAMAEVSDIPQPDVAALGQPWVKHAASRELGRGWKVRPYVDVPAGAVVPLMDIDGPGVIQHIWFTTYAKFHRDLILRMFWDDEPTPSVEVPLGDFFCNGWKNNVNILALPINVNPKGGLNCFFPMPFRRHARITVENRAPEKAPFFYTINYSLTPVADDDAYFHAQFRRVNPLPELREHTILEGVQGKGHYVGTYLAWQQNSNGWWGEGALKFFLDGDGEFPTICGTGTEDYPGGAYCFTGGNYSAPFLGYPEGTSGDPVPNTAGRRHGIYRFHVLDPIRFHQDLRVTVQALGWRSEGRFLPLHDDIASVAYWYQAEPHGPFPTLGDRNALEVI